MRVDVVMLTKDSNKPWFKSCLASIRSEVPVNQFILVDGFSNDGTISVVKDSFPEVEVIQDNSRLGPARKIGIQRVSTEWLVFIDSDVELLEGWWRAISSLKDDDVGAIQGFDTPVNPVFKRWIEWREEKWYPRIKKQRISDVNFRSSSARGYTHNTLIRTSTVIDWQPPLWLHIGEDYDLTKHVVQKGYRWRIYYPAIARHHSSGGLKGHMRKEAREMAACRQLSNAGFGSWGVSTNRLIRSLFVQFAKSLISSLQMKEPRIAYYITLKEMASIKGWIQWQKYL